MIEPAWVLRASNKSFGGSTVSGVKGKVHEGMKEVQELEGQAVGKNQNCLQL